VEIREGDRHRLFVRFARTHCQLRSAGFAIAKTMWRPARNVRLRQQELGNPRRAPVPIELGGGAQADDDQRRLPGPVTSRATVATFPKACESLTGGGHATRRIEADLPRTPKLRCGAIISRRRHRTAISSGAGLSGRQLRKGSTAEQGEASALMEAIERYSGTFKATKPEGRGASRILRRAMPLPPTTSCCSATRSPGPSRRPRRLR